MAVLGLHFCARAFSSCGKWRPLFIAVRGPLTITASLVAEHRLQTRRLSSCGSRAQLLRGMWDLPRPGLEPVSPALAGRFSTTVPPGKPRASFLSRHDFWGSLWLIFICFHLKLGTYFTPSFTSPRMKDLAYVTFDLAAAFFIWSTSVQKNRLIVQSYPG